MGNIGSLVTVNGGKVVEFDGGHVEVLGPNISGHCNKMVVAYASEGLVKVSMCFDDNVFYIQRFKRHSDVQHYWSKSMDVDSALKSKKYQKMANYCINAYRHIIMGMT